MIRFGCWLAAVAALVVVWQECGENLRIFCYRIFLSLFARTGSDEMIPVPVAQRMPPACSRHSETCSTRSTMWKD